ncbi:oxidored-nitro domain-containing protein [Holotrichia oblita]|uniref:Oxidored-nitro domain-containing protein n=1 Tax=Holotrichia oblita TaxID=644536 RepID=A0ACB9SRG9_HOLOL|nr:oxidored-nitro domain-containing protein [Holotrichia oblita]
MVYVVAQRLNAQDVPLDRSAFVLNQIISILISKELISDMMTLPQAVHSQERMKQTIGDIAQSSIMRLDAISMDKLWDLVTMVYKWQVTLGPDVLKITRRHVSELEDYISNGEVLLQLRRVQNIVDNFGVLLDGHELSRLKVDILDWLSESANNVKVSLLLKMGLQNVDGTFVTTDDALYRTRQYETILANLGQNIYNLAEAGDGSARSQRNKRENVTAPNNNNNNGSDDGGNEEVDLLVNQLAGGRRPRTNSTARYGENSPKRNMLKLNIGGGGDNSYYHGDEVDRNLNVFGTRRQIRRYFDDAGRAANDEASVDTMGKNRSYDDRRRSTIDWLADSNVNGDDTSASATITDLKEELLVLMAAADDA